MPQTLIGLVPAPAAIHRARGQRRGHRVTVGSYTAGARKFSERAPIVTHSPALDPAAVSTQPATAAQSAAVGDDDSCFHCGLPLDERFREKTRVLGRERAFCCNGCLAVARSIVDAGLEEYYEHRREKAITADVVPEIVRKLAFYDHPDVQKSFVPDRAASREASLQLENIRSASCVWLN